MEEKFENKESSPAYGMLLFSRVSGGDPNLFGSSVEHNHKISLTLRTGQVKRNLNEDWYLGDKTLFNVEMSYTQFAELISSMNVGSGVPVTIRFIKGEGEMPPVIPVSKRKQFIDEFESNNKDSNKQILALIEKVKAIFSEKRALKASEKQAVLNDLHQLSMMVDSHNTFIAKQFNETMEHISGEAKGEIEAFFDNKIRQLAAESFLEKGQISQQMGESPVVAFQENQAHTVKE